MANEIFWGENYQKKKSKNSLKSPANSFFQQDVHVKELLMMETKTIAKGKYFCSPARQRDSLVIYHVQFHIHAYLFGHSGLHKSTKF